MTDSPDPVAIDNERALLAGMAELNGAPILQFFAYQHLPAGLQLVSQPFSDLAKDIVHWLPANQERSVALRKLLEAKDCAVRAAIFKAD